MTPDQPPPGGRARRRARPGRVARPPAPAHPGPHRRGHRRRRRRLVRPAPPRAAACCRRATCGWRWPRWPATTTRPHRGPSVLQHRFGGTGALAGHPVGNLLLTGLVEVLGDPVPALDEVGRLLGVGGRVLPMCRVAAGHRGRGDRPRRRRPGRDAPDPRPGRDRHHARPGASRCRLLPADAAGLPGGRATRSRRPTWSCSAPAPGSPACCRTCWCPSCATRWSRTAARVVVVLNLAAAAGGDRRLLPGAAPGGAGGARAADCAVDAVIADADAVADRAWSDCRRCRAAVRELVLAPVAAGDGTARHDPGAARRGTAATVLDGVAGCRGQTAGVRTDGRTGGRGHASGDDGDGQGRAQPAWR